MGHYAVDFQCRKCNKCNCICPRPVITEKGKKKFNKEWLKVAKQVLKIKENANHD